MMSFIIASTFKLQRGGIYDDSMITSKYCALWTADCDKRWQRKIHESASSVVLVVVMVIMSWKYIFYRVIFSVWYFLSWKKLKLKAIKSTFKSSHHIELTLVIQLAGYWRSQVEPCKFMNEYLLDMNIDMTVSVSPVTTLHSILYSPTEQDAPAPLPLPRHAPQQSPLLSSPQLISFPPPVTS